MSPTKHILHICLQCLSFTGACLKSSLWIIYSSHEVFFPATVGKGLVIFLYHFHTLILIGFPDCSLWSATTAVYSLLLRLWQLSSILLKSSIWYPEWCNLYYPRKKDFVHIQMILWHIWCRASFLDAGFRPWYLWKQDSDAKCVP